MLAILYTLLGLVGLLLVACVVLWAVYVPRIVRILVESPRLLPDQFPPLDDGEPCDVPTSDGQTLRGVYLRSPVGRRRGVIAFCHELMSDRRGASPYVADLLDEGFDIFAFDFRNHGTSDAIAGYRPLHWITRYELDDVQAVVDYLALRPDADPRGVGLIGISKGGTAALAVAARDARVRAVVTDGAYASSSLQNHYFRRFAQIYIPWRWLSSRLPKLAVDAVSMWSRVFLGLRLGCRFVNIEPLVRRVRQPVLMVHGQCDTMIPLEVARALRDSLDGPSKLWIVPHARHNGAIVVSAAEYQRRLTRFFGRNLDGRPARPVRRSRVAAVRSWLSAQTNSSRAPKRKPVRSRVETG